MSSADLVILGSACLLVIAVALVATFALIEGGCPPIRSRLDAMLHEAAKKEDSRL